MLLYIVLHLGNTLRFVSSIRLCSFLLLIHQVTQDTAEHGIKNPLLWAHNIMTQ